VEVAPFDFLFSKLFRFLFLYYLLLVIVVSLVFLI
jgi:hypothetical protein